MKKTNRETLNKAVEVLVKKLHFKPEQIMVTGSLALELHGVLPENRNPHDCDFLITCDDQTWRCMKLVAAVYNENDNGYQDRDMLVFKINNIKFNIWRRSFADYDLKDKTGIWVSPVKDIIDAKKTIGRGKDYKDLTEICKLILG